MSSDPPYWGRLPPPRSVEANPRRLSDDLPAGASSLDRHATTPDAAAAQQPRAKPNRVSVQTTNTDAPTESTLSPFASPTRSSFQPQGLAPRPPSLPYAGDQYPPELWENRQRRRNKSQEQEQERDYHHYHYPDAGPGPLPAAPDVPPQAPPVSYKHPQGNGSSSLPYAYAAGGLARSFSSPTQMEGSHVYHSDDPNRGVPPPRHVSDSTRRGASTRDGARRSAAATEPSSQQQHHHPQRRSSLGQQQQQQQPDRRKFAVDRSPLQRLEKTLGSITKEEKRARVEAAERAVRERAAAAKQAGPVADEGGTLQQVRFGDPRGVKSGTREEGGAHPARPQVSTTQRGPLSQHPPDESSIYGSVAPRTPSTTTTQNQAPAFRTPVATPSGQAPSGIPQRNLSFRERAAKNDIQLPGGLESNPATAPTPTTTTTTTTTSNNTITTTNSPAGGTPSRTGSNKLRKNPPPPPRDAAWTSKAVEAERHIAGTRQQANGAGTRSVSFGPDPAAQPWQQRQQQLDGRRPDVVPGSVAFAAAPTSAAATGRSNPPPPPVPPPPASALHAQNQMGASSAGAARGGTQDAHPDRFPFAAGALGAGAAGGTAAAQARQHLDRRNDDDGDDGDHRHHVSDLVYHARDKLRPGEGLYQPPTYLDEWKKATVGTLSGDLLDLQNEPVGPALEKDKAWWETPPSQRRRGSLSSRPRKAEAFEGEYDDSNLPSRFKPPLYLKCGPLLRYCGMRTETTTTRTSRNGASRQREIWRGSVMIVTQDSESSYDITPTLRLFVQPVELLPPPPVELRGGEALAPEHVDPIAGHPKLGRRGETLYVRPVDHLREGVDLSRDETDDGLFERTRSPPDAPLPEGATDPPGSFAARLRRAGADGEKLGKYKDVRGFRLHAERGCTFWRFNIEVELRGTQQRVAYRINRGPATGFWVPARGAAMNVMFHSCNGFSLGADPDAFSGPDPLWRDVLNSHQSRPFHVMVGGGDQIYNDAVARQTHLFRAWTETRNPLHKHAAPLTPAMQDELEAFYLERYAAWFSQGLFGLANAQIPMVNMFDDHDIIDGFGSYPHHFMSSPVFCGLGSVAFKYYLLFQHQSVPDETEASEPAWILGVRPGPYIRERSRSLLVPLGARVALLAVDARTERTRGQVVREDTWEKIINRCYDSIEKGKVQHLLVLLGVPIAYPRLVWLENILTSRLLDPVKALGKIGLLGGFLNKFDGGVEVLDDLDDHWTAKDHKNERRIVIEDLQDLAADKSMRVTILSGDVHLAAVGQFYSNPRLGLAKHKDCRYMPNVISSAIVNAPPPDLLADVLNKRNKVHHFDAKTDEDMIPLFAHDVDGRPRNNKHLLPHRNWCAIREYVPGSTPPPSEYDDDDDGGSDESPAGGTPAGRVGEFLRSLSKSRRGPTFRGPDSSAAASATAPAPAAAARHDATPRPPVSRGGLLRSLSRRASEDGYGNPPPPRPGFLARTLSLGRGESVRNSGGGTGGGGGGGVGGLFRRFSSRRARRPRDDGGINGQWGPSEEDVTAVSHPPPPPRPYRPPYSYEEEDGAGVGLRGGAGSPPREQHGREYEAGDERHFSVVRSPPPPPAPPAEDEPSPRPFHRTPTGLSAKQIKRARGGAQALEVNLEGGLEVCLNAEVSPRDPAGITVPYRLLVPRLWYEDDLDQEGESAVLEGGGGAARRQVGGIKRWISLKKGQD